MKQLVIGDGKEGPPYPEDRYIDLKISKRSLLAAIRDLQQRVGKLEGSRDG